VTEQGEPSSQEPPVAPRQGLRRHRLEGGRGVKLTVRLSDAEYDAIAVRADSAGVNAQRFLVDSALASRRPQAGIPAALTAELSGIRRLLGSLANNMNQIARWLNSGGRPDARVIAAMDAVRRATIRLDTALGWLAPDRRNAHGERSGSTERHSADPERIRQSGKADPQPRNVPQRQNGDPRAGA
jgi:hypothetical protein